MRKLAVFYAELHLVPDPSFPSSIPRLLLCPPSLAPRTAVLATGPFTQHSRHAHYNRLMPHHQTRKPVRPASLSYQFK